VDELNKLTEYDLVIKNIFHTKSRKIYLQYDFSQQQQKKNSIIMKQTKEILQKYIDTKSNRLKNNYFFITTLLQKNFYKINSNEYYQYIQAK